MSEFPLPRLAPRLDPGVAAIEPGNLPPIADFSAAPTGNSVAFTNLSVDPDGTIEEYTWDFGDTPIKPIAAFSFTPNGLVVTFIQQSTDTPPGTIASYLWNFGDGTTSTAASPVKTYASSGSYTVTLTVTDNDALVSVPFTRVVHLGSRFGRPLGPMAGWESDFSPEPHSEEFSLIAGSDHWTNIVGRINYARDNGKHIMLIMTGGGHDQYKTDDKFDLGPNYPNAVPIPGVPGKTSPLVGSKWALRQDRFNTPAIRAAIRAGIEDGTIVGTYMIDEPNNNSAKKGWGGVFTRAILDLMADYVHAIFPTLPAGIALDWESELNGDGPGVVFHSVDFQLPAYLWRKGYVEEYVSGYKAYCDEQGLPYTITINPINGGYKPVQFPTITLTANSPISDTTLQVAALNKMLPAGSYLYFDNDEDKFARSTTEAPQGATVINVDPIPVAINDGDVAATIIVVNEEDVPGCPKPLTGGSGTGEVTAALSCAMTPQQYYDYAHYMLTHCDALVIWRSDVAFMGNPANKAKTVLLRAYADTLTYGRWSRRLPEP